jgi:hypothetical protein
MRICHRMTWMACLSLASIISTSALGAQAPPEPNAGASPPAVVAEPRLAEPNANGAGRIELMLNFREAPIRTIIDYLSERAGLTIVANVSPARSER